MNAEPLLRPLLRAIALARLEAILIGNAAAAIQGAPVTTIDFDFLFEKTPPNIAKLKRAAKRLDAVILRPFYPTSDLFRMVNDDTGLQADFMLGIHGVKSFASLRSRASGVKIGRETLLVATLSDIIAS